MKIHQILINDTGTLPETLPPYAEFCKNLITDHYGQDNYHLFCGKEIEKIIKENFHEDVFLSYKKLKPYAYKTDLARLCLLYLYGGLYVDLNTRFINFLDDQFLNQWNFFAFRDMTGSSVRNWSVTNSIMFSKPKSKVIKIAIDIIIEHCKNDYYGIQSTEPTGCIVIGRAIIFSKEEFCCTNGELICINSSMIDSLKKNLGFFTDLGDFIALRKPPYAQSGNIESMGFEGTNNYVEMWENKDIYDTTIKF